MSERARVFTKDADVATVRAALMKWAEVAAIYGPVDYRYHAAVEAAEAFERILSNSPFPAPDPKEPR